MSFDTRPALETHLHLAHTRIAIPKPNPAIFTLQTPENKSPIITLQQDSAQDLSIKREIVPELQKPNNINQLVCPVNKCNESFSIPGSLADHVRADHVGEGASKCPHCSYPLTNDELSKDHWLTHHKDVCSACVHVFTAVYGPQLWKKVHVKTQPSESPLDAIVNGLNRKRRAITISPSPDAQNYPPQSSPSDLSCQSEPHSPMSENQDYDGERMSKRSRKQRCPKKVIAVEDEEDDDEKFNDDELINDLSTNTDNDNKNTIRKTTKRKLLLKYCCVKCKHRPLFSSKIRLQMHKKWRHQRKNKTQRKNNTKH